MGAVNQAPAFSGILIPGFSRDFQKSRDRDLSPIPGSRDIPGSRWGLHFTRGGRGGEGGERDGKLRALLRALQMMKRNKSLPSEEMW